MPTASPTPALEPDTRACCDDPHDHTGHDHGTTGAEIVTSLVRGFSILSLVIPAIALIVIVAALVAPPSTPLIGALGLLLGGLQLGALIGTGLVVQRGDRRLSVHPGLHVARSILEEVLRVAVVLLAFVLWPAEAGGPMGLWIGAGCALVWIALATAQSVSSRRRIARESAWSTEMVATLLAEHVSVNRTLVMRVLDVVAVVLFQIGATMLIAAAPVMTLATIVLSIASSLSTLMLMRRTPSQRLRSAWALAPLAIGALTLLLALSASLAL